MSYTQRAKHTPGPWQYDDNTQKVWGRDDTPICRPAYYAGNPEQRNVNAHLIAAAPELLEACETTLANLAPKYASDHLVIKLLRSAIAKVEQNQPREDCPLCGGNDRSGDPALHAPDCLNRVEEE